MDTKALRQKILDLAIRGKLVPQDPNDEPASVLLEHIRAEKQQMVKDGKLKPKDIKNDTMIFKGEDNLHYEKFPDGTVKCIEDEIPFDVPEGWEWCRLGKILSLSSGKPVKVRELKDNDKYPVYGGNGINGRYTDYNVNENTIIIGRVGFYCGSIHMTKEKAWVTDNALITAIKLPHLCNIEYLSFMLEFLDLGKTSVSTAQPVVSGKGILPLIVAIPPLKEQNRICKRYKKMVALIGQIEQNKANVIDTVSAAKSKILDLAIRGKLVPQNPNDEPASVLLERIRAEKEELIKQGKIKRDKKESVIFKGEDNSYYHKLENEQGVSIKKIDLPQGWVACSLTDVTYMVGNKDNQIQTNKIEPMGKYPVISQGQDYIDGYCNSNDKVIHDLPVVMFGDHTRNVKYVTMPFVIGADGTKFHKAIILNSKYLFYWMYYTADKLRNRGYARHYALLKKEVLYLPPLNEQKIIVKKIEKYFQSLDEISKDLS